jgi:hypothetical protein
MSDTAGRRTLDQVVTIWDPLEEFVEVRIPPIARDRKASHRNITVVQLSQQCIVIRIIDIVFIVAITRRHIVGLVILGSRRHRVVAGAYGRRRQKRGVRVDRGLRGSRVVAGQSG